MWIRSVMAVAEVERRIDEEIERLKKALEKEEHLLVRQIIRDKIEELEHMRCMMRVEE